MKVSKKTSVTFEQKKHLLWIISYFNL